VISVMDQTRSNLFEVLRRLTDWIHALSWTTVIREMPVRALAPQMVFICELRLS
jgi:hypothetical protein